MRKFLQTEGMSRFSLWHWRKIWITFFSTSTLGDEELEKWKKKYAEEKEGEISESVEMKDETEKSKDDNIDLFI